LLDIVETGGQITVHIADALPRGYRGCAILAVIAQPPMRSQDAETLAAFHALLRMFYAAEESRRPEGGLLLQSVVPAAAMLPLPVAERRFKRLHKAMDERLAAAHAMASAFRAAEGRAASQPKRRKSQTLEDAGLETLEDDLWMRKRLTASGIGNLPRLPAASKNFLTRVLRPSLPVIHLAFAAAQLVEQGTKSLRQGPVELQDRHAIRLADGALAGDFFLGTLLLEDSFGELLLERAEQLEVLLPWLSGPQIKDFVRLRLQPHAGTAIVTGLTHAHRAAEPERLPAGVDIKVPHGADPALTAAILLAAVSCVPRGPDDPTLAEEVAALYRPDFQRRLELDPSIADHQVVGDLRHFSMPLVRARAIEKRIRRALRARLLAARILAPAVQAAVSGVPLPPASDGKAWSLAGAIRRVLAQDSKKVEVSGETPGGRTNRSRVANTEVRVIAPSRPVLPLAIAISFVQQQMARSTGRPLGAVGEVDFDALLEAPAEVAAIVKLAAELEEAACALPAGGPDPKTVVRIRLI
jgi:hypothetical protein